MSFTGIDKYPKEEIAKYFSNTLEEKKDFSLKEKAQYVQETYGEGTIASIFAREVIEFLDNK